MTEKAAYFIFAILLLWIGLACIVVSMIVLFSEAFKRVSPAETSRLAKELVEYGIISISRL